MRARAAFLSVLIWICGSVGDRTTVITWRAPLHHNMGFFESCFGCAARVTPWNTDNTRPLQIGIDERIPCPKSRSTSFGIPNEYTAPHDRQLLVRLVFGLIHDMSRVRTDTLFSTICRGITFLLFPHLLISQRRRLLPSMEQETRGDS
ncbi:hypothetical protein BDP81DRAFT_437131 [Colletotrichum phormii]|uniref:Secreted protein n=1 Tax=Colletotrichum phormii TaxID=359342 RepID=A0AAI9ZHH1_9PEZI|nr:uncharacterized protein BDP81DRAFT_437131 [Colletotrichum phormii]KAK1624650.1 hypothetical protein BDP81DRAFT_437131 [Colletotrichum phormii]